MKKKATIFFSRVFIFASLILLALFLRWTVMEIYVLPFHGMMPTLFPNDHLITNKLAYGLRLPFLTDYILRWSAPKRGEVIVFRSPFDTGSLSIRRVVGIPGDRIFFENGNLYINEKRIIKKTPSKVKKDFLWVRDEDFSAGGLTEDKSHYTHYEEKLSDITYSVLLNKKKRGYLIFGPYLIPPEYYFVMGDHRDRSQDSRTWPARLQKAEGTVTFFRSRLTKEKPAGAIKIPKGLLIRTEDPELPEYFETVREVILKGPSVSVKVLAKKAGLSGNVSAGRISVIEGPLSLKLRVRNRRALSKGRDKNLVFEPDILGRISRVWFSCEKKLLSLLCDPRYIRWGRTFFPVHHRR